MHEQMLNGAYLYSDNELSSCAEVEQKQVEEEADVAVTWSFFYFL